MYSILGVKIDLIFVLRSQFSIFCAKLCTNMPWSTWKRLVQKKNGSFCFLPTVNAYLLLTSFEVYGRDTFSVLAPVLGPSQKMAKSPCPTVHGGQYDAKYVTFELLMHAACVADEIWGFICLNQLVYITRYKCVFLAHWHFFLFRPRVFSRALGTVARREPARTPRRKFGPWPSP